MSLSNLVRRHPRMGEHVDVEELLEDRAVQLRVWVDDEIVVVARRRVVGLREIDLADEFVEQEAAHCPQALLGRR